LGRDSSQIIKHQLGKEGLLRVTLVGKNREAKFYRKWKQNAGTGNQTIENMNSWTKKGDSAKAEKEGKSGWPGA